MFRFFTICSSFVSFGTSINRAENRDRAMSTRRPIHESYTHVKKKSSRWMQVSHDNNNVSNGSKSEYSDIFEEQYKSSLYSSIMNLFSVLWSCISLGNKEMDMKTPPKRFPGTAAEGFGISWYSLPVYWSYTFCLWIHLHDIWLLSLFHKSHAQSKNRHLIAVVLLLMSLPFIVLAGLVLTNCCSLSNCMSQLQNTVKWESALFSPVEF